MARNLQGKPPEMVENLQIYDKSGVLAGALAAAAGEGSMVVYGVVGEGMQGRYALAGAPRFLEGYNIASIAPAAYSRLKGSL